MFLSFYSGNYMNLTWKGSQRWQFLNKRRIHQMDSRVQITSKPVRIKINGTIGIPIAFQSSPNPLLQYFHLILLVAQKLYINSHLFINVSLLIKEKIAFKYTDLVDIDRLILFYKILTIFLMIILLVRNAWF